LSDSGELPQHAGPGRNFALCLMLGIAYAASIGGVGTIIGTPPNVFLVGYLRDGVHVAHQTEISFLQWLAVGMPMVALMIPIAWFGLTSILFPVGDTAIEGGREFVARELKCMGPMKRGERITLVVFAFTCVLWISRQWLTQWTVGEGENAWQPFKLLTDAGIVMIAAMLLFVTPVNVRKGRFTLDWDMARRLPWGVLILFGGGLSLASAIEANGVAEFIGGQTQRFAGLPEIALVLIVAAVVVFFSEVASNTATATTLIPILYAMAPGLGVHPFMLVFPAGLAASLAFMMPVGTPPNAIVYGTGYVSVGQMAKAGFLLNIISVLLITLMTFLIVKPLFVT
jgi:sodium-dependent dicarboxylate transporter 2/3/5